MRLTLSRYAFRISNRLPEILAVTCYVAGAAVCVAIVKGFL